MSVTRAFYMAPADLRVPRTGEVIEPGAVVRCKGPPVLCSVGLHASVDVLDAVNYRGEGCLTLVDVGGDVAVGDDKICGTERRTIAVLTVAQTERVLREIACACAECALQWGYYDLGEEPDQRSIDAIDVARRFARGECTRSELDAARAAAGAAARAAARDAARAAARDAAGAAARAAARAAAWAAAGDAAWAAAGDAAWAAAGAAARAAAGAAARDAAGDVANRMALEALISSTRRRRGGQ